MKKKFITIHTLHQNNIEGDCVTRVRAEMVAFVSSATLVDKKHRLEINSIVTLVNGMTFAATEKPEEIVALLEELGVEE